MFYLSGGASKTTNRWWCPFYWQCSMFWSSHKPIIFLIQVEADWLTRSIEPWGNWERNPRPCKHISFDCKWADCSPILFLQATIEKELALLVSVKMCLACDCVSYCSVKLELSASFELCHCTNKWLQYSHSHLDAVFYRCRSVH